LDVWGCGVGGVDGEGEVAVDFIGDVGLEDQRDGGVGGVDVVGVFDQGGVDVVILVFADDEDVAGRARPLQGEEVLVVGFYAIILSLDCLVLRMRMEYP
jgi:hypothetical protein